MSEVRAVFPSISEEELVGVFDDFSLGVVRGIAETVSLTESAGRSIDARRVLVETASLVDDIITLQEGVSRQTITVRVGVSGVSDRIVTAIRPFDEIFGLAETATRSGIFQSALTDVVGVDVVLTRAGSFGRTFAEISGVSDVAVRSASRFRSFGEVAGSVDLVNPTGIHLQTVTETVSSIPTLIAGKSGEFAVSMAEVVSATDIVVFPEDFQVVLGEVVGYSDDILAQLSVIGRSARIKVRRFRTDADFTIKRYDTSPDIEAVLTRQSGNVVDLRGKSADFVLRDPLTDTTKIKEDAVVLDPLNGVVMYEWSSDDTDETGTFYGEFEVTKSDGDVLSFPRDGYYDIEIVEDLD